MNDTLRQKAVQKGGPFYKQAVAIGISPTEFSEIICDRRIPTRENIAKIEAYYGVPGRELFPETYDLAMKNTQQRR